MKPIRFPEANRTFTSPPGEEGRVYPLVAHFEPSIPMVVECWQPTLRERLSVLVFGRVWISFLARSPQPIAVRGVKTVFFEPDLEERINRSLVEVQKKAARPGREEGAGEEEERDDA